MRHVALALFLLFAPAAAADDLEGYLTDGTPVGSTLQHYQETRDAARDDPVAFAEAHASPDAAQAEAAWAVGQTCWTAAYAGAPEEAPYADLCAPYMPDDAGKKRFDAREAAAAALATMTDLAGQAVERVQELPDRLLQPVRDAVETVRDIVRSVTG